MEPCGLLCHLLSALFLHFYTLSCLYFVLNMLSWWAFTSGALQLTLTCVCNSLETVEDNHTEETVELTNICYYKCKAPLTDSQQILHCLRMFALRAGKWRSVVDSLLFTHEAWVQPLALQKQKPYILIHPKWIYYGWELAVLSSGRIHYNFSIYGDIFSLL